MKTLVHILLYLMASNVLAQSLDTANSVQKQESLPLEKSATDFVLDMRDKYSKISEYMVFVMRSGVNDSCAFYSLGFIFSPKDFARSRVSHYIKIENEIALVFFDSPNDRLIPGFEVFELDSTNLEKIVSRMLDEESYITGVFEGMVYNVCGRNSSYTFYENSDVMPRNKSFLIRDLPPYEIKLIKKEE